MNCLQTYLEISTTDLSEIYFTVNKHMTMLLVLQGNSKKCCTLLWGLEGFKSVLIPSYAVSLGNSPKY